MDILSESSQIVNFLIYCGSAVGITVCFLAIYVRITPYREFALINEGNTAAACSLCGALFGFILPLASAIINSIDFFDMLLWSIIALAIQTCVYLLVARIFTDMPRAIEEGNTAKGMLLGALSLAAGMINAACISY